METRDVVLHGRRVRVARAGRGPAIVLLHGIVSSLETWAGVFPALSRHHLVLAPDLRGHGRSTGGPGDYSLGAHASGVRDLMDAMDVERATIIGHSLGGGVAMQFSYQHPERTERLVLVGSGGLGPEVGPLLRLASLPGTEWVLPLFCSGPLVRTASRAGTGLSRLGLGRLGLRAGPRLSEGWRSYSWLADPAGRRAFLSTLRSVVGPRGQTVSAQDKLYLAHDVPTMLVWGERDAMIPVAHAWATHLSIANSRLEVFDGAGHFPHQAQPERFVTLVQDFIASTRPAVHDRAARRRLLTERAMQWEEP